ALRPRIFEDAEPAAAFLSGKRRAAARGPAGAGFRPPVSAAARPAVFAAGAGPGWLRAARLPQPHPKVADEN
nr:hypothetical protein [Tanacetum cinerariifolium]